MQSWEARILKNNSLNHYASPYYDPVKAHEYYMKNRKLKGRTTSGMSDEQKKAWGYAKDQITTEKKAKIESQKDIQDKKIEELRARADATRQRITEKLRLLSEKLSEDAKDDREDISEQVKAKIDALPPIPKNISPEKKAKLMKQRKEEIAKIRGEASKDREKVSKDTKLKRTSINNKARVDRTQVRNELKESIKSVRDDFKKKKEELVKKYEATYDKEYDNIIKNIPGKAKKNKGRRKKKK